MNAKRLPLWSLRLMWAMVGCLLLQHNVSARGVPDTDGRGSMFGQKAPDFRIKGPHGQTYSLDRVRGQVIVMQFGSSW